jgi:hypothetical protein
MLSSRLKILPADKAFKKIITKDDNVKEVGEYKGYSLKYNASRSQYYTSPKGGVGHIFGNDVQDLKRKIDKWRIDHNVADANPDLINMYKQKFEEAIESGDKEEMKRWFREIMNNVSFNDAEPQIVGKHNDTPDDQFDADELAKGIQIEMEHTDDEVLAKSIAKDHLAEIKDYYTRLLKMEAEAKQ